MATLPALGYTKGMKKRHDELVDFPQDAPGGLISSTAKDAAKPCEAGLGRERGGPGGIIPPGGVRGGAPEIARHLFIAQGRVQGVGFRPFVFSLAEEYGLTGSVRNTSEGVRIEVQGEAEDIADFGRALETRLPPLAVLTKLRGGELAPVPGEAAFVIAKSAGGPGHSVLIGPDTALCADCREDMRAGRRKGYAFTNCTNCGPRYTITRSIPYDRAATSMACFPFCSDCREEYENPRDRRFHAQPNACPVCGPTVWFTREQEPERTGREHPASLEGEAGLRALAELLRAGGLAAVKGLGGFHLACDAWNVGAVERLRHKKNRPHKPLALMVPDLDAARALAEVGEEEADLLCSPAHPIVLCRKKDAGLPESLAPATDLLGIMLPYTPLHEALFRLYAPLCADPAALVMTSGNRGGEPICLGNREAVGRLAGIAEVFLFHNRDILIRVDDSVVRPMPEGRIFLRRARGYVPLPTSLPFKAEGCVLGVGAELKHTLCLTKGADAFVSQHIGDLENVETADFAEEIRRHLEDLLQVRPEVIVRDLHPDYRSSELAEAWATDAGIPCLSLPHHAAHAFAVLGENGRAGQALALTLDGTGLGEGGTLQGGELLWVHPERGEFKRLAGLEPVPLPGGEAAVREPWRIAYALLARYNLLSRVPFAVPEGKEEAARLIPAMLERGLNCPPSSGCGRLFDAVSALLGLCATTTYEGQAAIRLEKAVDSGPAEAYAAPSAVEDPKTGLFILQSHALFLAVAEDLRAGVGVGVIARRFHLGLARLLADAAVGPARAYGVTHVGLSGGCLNNAFLAVALAAELRQRGLTPLTHRELPPGDGCISYGQALYGAARKNF